MPVLFPKPEPFESSTNRKLSAADLNRMLEALHREISGAGGISANRYGDRIVVSLNNRPATLGSGSSPAAAVTKMFIVVTEHDDYLDCVPLEINNNLLEVDDDPNPDDAIPLVQVAKPFLLQKTPWLQQVLSPLAGSSALANPIEDLGTVGKRKVGDEVQGIYPEYIRGDIIVATPTNVTLPSSEGDSETFRWVDLNNGGRTWSGESPPGEEAPQFDDDEQDILLQFIENIINNEIEDDADPESPAHILYQFFTEAVTNIVSLSSNSIGADVSYYRNESSADGFYAPWYAAYPCAHTTGVGQVTTSPTSDVIYIQPFVISRATRINYLGYMQTTPGAGGSKIRCAIYSSVSGNNLLPNALMVETSERSGSIAGNGFFADSVSVILQPGLYWGAVLVSGTVNVLGADTDYLLGLMGNNTDDGSPLYGAIAAYTFGAFPNPFPLGSLVFQTLSVWPMAFFSTGTYP